MNKFRSSLSFATALLAVAVTSPVVANAVVVTKKVPDAGSTALMFGGAVLVIAMIRRQLVK